MGKFSQFLRSTLHHMGQKEKAEDMVIDIIEVQERFKHYRNFSRGYLGLCYFMVFVVWYVWILSWQQHQPSVGQANNGLRLALEKSKADLVTSNTATMWTFFSTKVVKLFMGPPWKNVTSNGTVYGGATSFEFFYLVGGAAITVVSSQEEACFRGNPCYSDVISTAPFLELDVPGTNATTKFQVPYNEFFGGYTVGIPATIDAASQQAFLKVYEGLMTPRTREIRLSAVLFNPNAEKTITTVTLTGKLSVHSDVSYSVAFETIPYYLYSSDVNVHLFRVFMELLLVVYICKWLAMPLIFAFMSEPEEEDPLDNSEEELARVTERNVFLRLKYLAASEYLPVDSAGEVVWLVALLLWIAFFVALGMWLNLCWQYSLFEDLGSDSFDDFFQEPLRKYEAVDPLTQLKSALFFLNSRVLPYMGNVSSTAQAFEYYFMMQTLVVLLTLLRFFQYLQFQKRLSVVTDTFRGIADDLIHICFVTFSVCFTIGLMCSLSYGQLDPNFQALWPSFYSTVENAFGMFKPAAAQQYNPALDVYKPHMELSNSYITWVPFLLQLLFKALVMLLLFKLLMGVIMESYKKHAHVKTYPHSMRWELSELAYLMWYYYWQHCFRKKPYVPFGHLVTALALIQEATKDKDDRPWRKRYVGLARAKGAIRDALNDAYHGEPAHMHPSRWPKIKAIAKMYGYKQVDLPEENYVLRHYGKKREVAKFELTTHVLTTEKEKKLKELRLERGAKDPTLEEREDAQAERHAVEVLEDMQRKLNAAFSTDNMGDHELQKEAVHKYELDPKEIQRVFEAFDFYGTGQIDIRFMSQALGPSPGLKFDLPRKLLRKLLIKHDEDENQCFDWKEFKHLLNDPILQGRYIGDALKVKREKHGWQKLRGVVNTMTRSFTRRFSQKEGDEESPQNGQPTGPVGQLDEPLLEKGEKTEQKTPIASAMRQVEGKKWARGATNT